MQMNQGACNSLICKEIFIFVQWNAIGEQNHADAQARQKGRDGWVLARELSRDRTDTKDFAAIERQQHEPMAQQL
jgi:hypothetical protein